VNGFTLQTPTKKGEHRLPLQVHNHVTAAADNTIRISHRIRWKTTLSFKPDDSVDLYGDKDVDDEDEEEFLPGKDDPDVTWMATYLANRLARAYIKGKLQQNTVDSQERTGNVAKLDKTTEVVSPVKGVADTTTNNKKSSDGRDAEETKPIILSPAVDTEGNTNASRGSSTTTGTPMDEVTKSEKVARELLTRRESETSVLATAADAAAKQDEEDDETQSEVHNEVKDGDKRMTSVVPENMSPDVEESTEDVETAEVPSLMHEKEGDRKIGLKDDFVDVTDGEGELWSGIPAIPNEISLDFGRPLQVVRDGIPPIRS